LAQAFVFHNSQRTLYFAWYLSWMMSSSRLPTLLGSDELRWSAGSALRYRKEEDSEFVHMPVAPRSLDAPNDGTKKPFHHPDLFWLSLGKFNGKRTQIRDCRRELHVDQSSSSLRTHLTSFSRTQSPHRQQCHRRSISVPCGVSPQSIGAGEDNGVSSLISSGEQGSQLVRVAWAGHFDGQLGDSIGSCKPSKYGLQTPSKRQSCSQLARTSSVRPFAPASGGSNAESECFCDVRLRRGKLRHNVVLQDAQHMDSSATRIQRRWRQCQKRGVVRLVFAEARNRHHGRQVFKTHSPKEAEVDAPRDICSL